MGEMRNAEGRRRLYENKNSNVVLAFSFDFVGQKMKSKNDMVIKCALA